MEHLCYNLKSQSRKYNHRKPESSAEHLDGSLFVVFGIQDLFATHCTDAWKKKKRKQVSNQVVPTSGLFMVI